MPQLWEVVIAGVQYEGEGRHPDMPRLVESEEPIAAAVHAVLIARHLGVEMEVRDGSYVVSAYSTDHNRTRYFFDLDAETLKDKSIPEQYLVDVDGWVYELEGDANSVDEAASLAVRKYDRETEFGFVLGGASVDVRVHGPGCPTEGIERTVECDLRYRVTNAAFIEEAERRIAEATRQFVAQETLLVDRQDQILRIARSVVAHLGEEDLANMLEAS